MSLQDGFKRISGRIRELYLDLFLDVSRAVDRSITLITRRSRQSRTAPTYSWGRTDYLFWRKAYFAKVSGLELSGLFIRPIVNKIAAWVLGRSPNFQSKSKVNQKELDKWWDQNHSAIIEAFTLSMLEGDSFFVVNSDLTITILPPDTVDPIVDDNDYGKQIGWRSRQVFPHPDNSSKKMTVTDEYYVDRRVHIEEFSDKRTRRVVYPNLIGIIPVIHVANFPLSGEKFGHPEAEALLELLHRYGQTLEAAIEGNILQGRPTPVISFKTIQDLNAFWRRYGQKETTRKSDGTSVEVDSLSIDMSDLMTLSGADFKYESPGSFAEDTEKILGLLFYLILEHIELPEFVLGNAIEGSKASAETQMPIFEVFIRMRQKRAAKWILETAKVVQGYMTILRPGVITDKVSLRWAKISQNGRLTLETVQWAYENNLLDEKLALLMLPADIENPDEVLKLAKREAKIRAKNEMLKMEETLKMQAENAPTQPSGGGGKRATEMDPTLEKEINSLNI